MSLIWGEIGRRCRIAEKMRDELLNGEILDTMIEAKVLIEKWRAYYNTIRPHSSLEYRSPAPEFKVVDISLKMA